MQTLDFFPPLVDDPFVFGQIAAANALSDVYAMNGQPLTALNIVGFPDNELPLEVLGAILRGGADRVARAGAVTIGGHSVRDAEIKYGLSVTGLVHPDAVWTNAGAQPGDVLVLTKPLGTGFITTAAKKEQCPPEVLDRAIASMIELNAGARDALRAAGGAHAVTDITGFGLAGHGAEMAAGSGCTLELDVARLPIIPGSETLADARFYNRANKGNRDYVAGRLRIEPGLDPVLLEYAFDPQTSGGLLIALVPEHVEELCDALRLAGAPAAAIVGRVTQRQGPDEIVLR